jgi:putative GTP pyrophosphokinase
MAEETEDPVAAYANRRDSYIHAAERLRQLLADCLDEANIGYMVVKSRAKAVGSFAQKSAKTDGATGEAKYKDPLREIEDLVAARVVTYSEGLVDRVAAVVGKRFFLTNALDKGAETRANGEFGYASKHYNARLLPHYREVPGFAALAGLSFEIQVRTVAQHAWAEYEHSVRYKGGYSKGTDAEIDRLFIQAGSDAERLDEVFTKIGARVESLAQDAAPPEPAPQTQELTRQSGQPQITGASLRGFLEERYPQPGTRHSKPHHYDWIAGLLVLSGFDTFEAVSELLRDVDSAAVKRAINHEFPPGQVRRLEDDLLCALGQGWIDGYKREIPEDELHWKHLNARRRMLQDAGLWRG